MPRTAIHSHQDSSWPSGRLDQLLGDPDALLFVYGSLQFPEVLHALLGRVPPTTDAQANGWHVTALVDAVYPGLVAGAGPTTGLVLSGLTADEWRVIDAFEDDVYDLRTVDLTDGRLAWAYTCPTGSNVSIEAAWDARNFAEHHLTDYVRQCAAWLDRYRASEANGSSGTARQ